MLRASIDIGSNTVLLLIAEVQNSQLKEIVSKSSVTALGRDLDKLGEFHPESMNETYATLKNYRKELKRMDIAPEDVIVTATEASRVARNAPTFFEKVKKELGFIVTIINDHGEAHYTSLGVCAGSTSTLEEAVIMDIGGASTELIKIKVKPYRLIKSISLPIGSVRATEWIKSGEYQQKLQEIFSKYNLDDYKAEKLICVAGSMTSLGGMMKGLSSFDSEQINGADIPFKAFKNFISKIENDDPQKLLNHYPFLEKRANTIVAGAKLAIEIAQKCDVKNLEISTYGLRHGTAMSGTIEHQFLART